MTLPSVQHDQMTAALDAIVTDTAAGRLIPGARRCILRVETSDGQQFWANSATTSAHDANGLNPSAAFRIASVTKMMTATALLTLADRGMCRLDDQAGQYLPGAVVDRFRTAEGRPYAATLTLRQLLDHTSGLPNYFTSARVLDAIRHGDYGQRFQPLDLIEIAANAEPPRESTSPTRAYTDTGFVLAGLVIELLSGRPLGESFRQLIFDPTGMNATWLEGPGDAPLATVSRHDLGDEDITAMDPTVDWAGGGLVSTALDLTLFLRALTHGHLLTGRTWREMTHWRPGPQGFYDDYGLGLGRYLLGGAELIGHHGVWGAFAFWCPKLDTFITGTVNSARTDRRPLLDAVVRALERFGPSSPRDPSQPRSTPLIAGSLP